MPPRNNSLLGAFAAGLLDRDAPLPSGLREITAAPVPHGYAVLRNGATTGLIGVLKAIYPTLLRLIGEENFTGLSHLYIIRHPPRSPVLHEYGQAFAAHVAEQAQLAHLPFLPDVARVERAWLDAWHAADAPALTAAALETIDPEGLMALRLVPHPAAHLLRLASSAASLVRIDRAGADLADFDPTPAQSALITRPDVIVQTEVLTEAQAAFLAALLSGRTLGEAAEAGLIADPDMDLPAAIALMIGSGAFRERDATS